MGENDIRRYTPEILRTMNDGLVLIRPDGTIVMVNPALERLTGYRAEELIGRPCTALRCDACRLARSKGGDKWCQLFDTKQETRKRCGIVRKDGTYVPVLKSATLFMEDGQVLGSVETLTDVSEIAERDRMIEELTRLVRHDEGFHGMLGRSPAMLRTFEIIDKAAQSDAPVIITGESGTGKELAARAIHDLGPRKKGPYIQLNCAALNEALLESELFGHIKGAFTGAYRHRQDRFEAAHTGDIFLDEIGDVPLSIQVKLLRVLETKRFERVGDHQPVSVDVRFITATNRDLQGLVREGRFREDLFFRINVIPIHLPPLRERREDIPLLVDHFIRDLRARSGKDISSLAPEAMELLMAYPWPGNVRELKSALEYGFVISDLGPLLPHHLPHHIAAAPRPACGPAPLAAGSAERQALLDALRQARGNKSETARILGVTRVTVLNRMRKYGIDLQKTVTG